MNALKNHLSTTKFLLSSKRWERRLKAWGTDFGLISLLSTGDDSTPLPGKGTPVSSEDV